MFVNIKNVNSITLFIEYIVIIISFFSNLCIKGPFLKYRPICVCVGVCVFVRYH